MNCSVCFDVLVGRQNKYCSKKCKTSYSSRSGACQRERGKARKLKLIQLLGGKCNRCGYAKNYAALQFHHMNPKDKLFNIDIRKCSNTRWVSLINEAKKCELLCANCHFEHHNPNYGCGIEVYEPYKGMSMNIKTINLCDCGNVMYGKALRCQKCRSLMKRKVTRPSKEELQKLVWEKATSLIAKDYGVSDNAIGKWCKSYNISKPPRGYWAKVKWGKG